MTFDLDLVDLGVKVTQNVAQYPLHYVTYLGTKFEVAVSNGLGGDAFTRNVTDGGTDGQTDGRRTDFGTLFSKEKSGYKNAGCEGNKITDIV